MIVFDVDGTLLGGESYDWQAFEDAFEEAAGFRLTEEFFCNLEEVTAKAIVHQALPELQEEERLEIERKTGEGYLSRLEDVFLTNPNSFPAVGGVIELLEEIQSRNIPLAIATGDWRPSITLKLKAAKIPYENLPIVTSSEHYHRHECIAKAIQEAEGSLDNAIYVGDGVWDLKATQKLGIHFIGCGTRRERLRQAGAKHVLESFEQGEFWGYVRRILG
jgi:phosphoglycolate phosphatase-like HAD superfamily hydrolase